MADQENRPANMGQPCDLPGGLRSLSAEDKGRIGQLIKVLAQERRDKEQCRQEMKEQASRLEGLEKERELGKQNEEALITKVSRSLHLLREYQQELGSRRNPDRLRNHRDRKREEKSPVNSNGMTADVSSLPVFDDLGGARSAPSKVPSPSKATAVAACLNERSMPHPRAREGRYDSCGHNRGHEETPRPEPERYRVESDRHIVGRHLESRAFIGPSPPLSPASSWTDAERPRSNKRSQREVGTSRSASICANKTSSAMTSLGVLRPPQLSLLQRYLHIQQGGSTTFEAAAEAVEDSRLNAGEPWRPDVASDGAGIVALPRARSSQITCSTQRQAWVAPTESDVPQPSTLRCCVSKPSKRMSEQSTLDGNIASLSTLTVSPSESSTSQFPSAADVSFVSAPSSRGIRVAHSESGEVQQDGVEAISRNAACHLATDSQVRVASPRIGNSCPASPTSVSRPPAILSSKPRSPASASFADLCLHGGGVGSPIAGHRSSSLGRISGSRVSDGRASGSWPGPIHDGYYGNAMFDVLDSVESALCHNAPQVVQSVPCTWSAPRAASVSGCDSLRSSGNSRSSLAPWTHGSEVHWMHSELSKLERRVYGTHGSPQSKHWEGHRSDLLEPARSVFSTSERGPPSPPRPLAARGLPSPPRPLVAHYRDEPAAPLWERDVARPSSPPRKSREFDLDDGQWTGGKKSSDSEPPLAHSVEEIDDVLSLLRRSPSYS